MYRSFSYTLLITWILLLVSCSTQFVQKSYETSNLSVSSELYPLDSALVQLYQPYKEQLDADMNRVISQTESQMVKGKPESALTNFLADLLLEEGAIQAGEKGLNIKPDVSYFNYGGIRTFLPKGDVKVRNVFELMPFENEMVYLKLSGVQLKEFLDHVASRGGDSVGGVRFLISAEQAAEITVNGEKLREDAYYWLVTNDYVANGGDGLEVLTKSEAVIQSGLKIRDAIIGHMEGLQRKGEIINTKKDGRIGDV